MWRLSATVRHKNTTVSCTSQRSSSVWRRCAYYSQRAYRVLKIIKERILLLLLNMTNVSEMCLSHFSKTTTGNKENECDSPPSLPSRENTWTTYWAPVSDSTAGQKKVRILQIAACGQRKDRELQRPDQTITQSILLIQMSFSKYTRMCSEFTADCILYKLVKK